MHEYPDDQIFTKSEIEDIFNHAVGKTLMEVDSRNVLERTKTHPKITGIAGDVIERSVLGYRPNSRNAPDILVDGIETEVKVTGVVADPESKGTKEMFIAKEPMTITAVSIKTIGSQEFLSSPFYEKIDHMLIVYYLYMSNPSGKTQAADYAEFPIKGYELHEFSDDDIRKIERDWTMIRDFIRNIDETYEKPEMEYPRLSSDLRGSLLCLDTAPKWPNPPRFRFKRAFVTDMVRQHFGRCRSAEEGNLSDFESVDELEALCHATSERYRGRTIRELAEDLDVNVARARKSVSEQIVISMLGGGTTKMRNIGILERCSILPFSIVLNPGGGPTESTKLMGIDFDEFLDKGIQFQDSEIFDYFVNNSFLAIVFQETEKDNLLSSRFLGFKKIVFPMTFIKKQVRRTWKDTRRIVWSGHLRETERRRKDGSLIINKNGTVSTTINLPKSRDHPVFIRGTGQDSSRKTEEVNGIRMYRQNIWIKGKTIVEFLDSIEYL